MWPPPGGSNPTWLPGRLIRWLGPVLMRLPSATSYSQRPCRLSPPGRLRQATRPVFRRSWLLGSTYPFHKPAGLQRVPSIPVRGLGSLVALCFPPGLDDSKGWIDQSSPSGPKVPAPRPTPPGFLLPSQAVVSKAYIGCITPVQSRCVGSSRLFDSRHVLPGLALLGRLGFTCVG